MLGLLEDNHHSRFEAVAKRTYK